MLTNNWDFIIKQAGFTSDDFIQIAGEIREAYNNMMKAAEVESNLAYVRHGTIISTEIEKMMFSSFWNWLVGRQDITGINQASLLFIYALKDEDGVSFDGNLYVETMNSNNPSLDCVFRKEVQENDQSVSKHHTRAQLRHHSRAQPRKQWGSLQQQSR